MFDMPQAKRVRRDDLESRSLSPEVSSAVSNTAIEARFKELYQPDFNCPSPSQNDTVSPKSASNPNQNDDPEADGFEFRLFSKPVTKSSNMTVKANSATRIILRSPSPVNGGEGGLKLGRPVMYYFTNEISQDLNKSYGAAAVSGDVIRQWSKSRWPGSELPWRVMSVKATGHARPSSSQNSVTPNVSKSQGRKRNGKKRRIAIRKKIAVVDAKLAIASMTKEEKDAAEQEKRTRRNREKKVKKKEKDKLKKIQSATLDSS